MSQKLKWIVGIVVAVIVIIWGYSALVKPSNTIKIGALLPLTGGLASYGEPAQKMADIALTDINANGGINGRMLEIRYEDHKCDPKEMLSGFEKLLTENIHIFNSVACSATVSSVAPNLEKDNALLLGTITSASKLTGVSPYFYRNWASDGQEAKLLSEQIIQKNYKNIAVIYEETDYAKGLKLAMESDLKDSGVKIASESFVSGATDVRTQLTKLKSLKPDVVFISVQTVPSGEIVLTQMEQLGFKPKMLINDNILKASSLLKNHTTLLEGAIGGDYYFKDSEKLNSALAEYKIKYGVDCPQKNICAAEYDAIQFLAQAIKSKGNSANGVKEYLSQNTYSGISGDISFDANNDRNNSEYSLFVIKSGEATRI